MKKLNQIKKELSEKEILQVNEAQNVKGGQRFVTTSYFAALVKNILLKASGHHTSFASGNGEYCIEW